MFTVLFHFLNRNLVFIKHGWLSRKSRSEEKFKHYQQMMKDGRDVSLLRMFDSFVESAPQLIIQIYIAMHHPSQESLHLGIYIYIKKKQLFVNTRYVCPFGQLVTLNEKLFIQMHKTFLTKEDINEF